MGGRLATGEIATMLTADKPPSEPTATGPGTVAPRGGSDTTSGWGAGDGPTEAAGAVRPPSTGTVGRAATGSVATLGEAEAPESVGVPERDGVPERLGRPESEGWPACDGEPESDGGPPAVDPPLRENVVDVGRIATGGLTFG